MATLPMTSALVHRLTADDVIAMVEAEILDEHARVELVEGVLVDMNPIGIDHDHVVGLLTEHFVPPLVGRMRVRTQSMLLTPGGNYVLPDVVVIDVPPKREHPTTARLVIEVAQSSHARDREKIADYAGIGVAEYWIVDLVAREAVVHRGPAGTRYETITTYRDGAVDCLIDGVPPLELAGLFTG